MISIFLYNIINLYEYIIVGHLILSCFNSTRSSYFFRILSKIVDPVLNLLRPVSTINNVDFTYLFTYLILKIIKNFLI